MKAQTHRTRRKSKRRISPRERWLYEDPESLARVQRGIADSKKDRAKSHRLESDPRFLKRVEKSRESLSAGSGVRLEGVAAKIVAKARRQKKLSEKQAMRIAASETKAERRSAIKETLHLLAIPGMRESIRRGLRTPLSKTSKKQ